MPGQWCWSPFADVVKCHTYVLEIWLWGGCYSDTEYDALSGAPVRGFSMGKGTREGLQSGCSLVHMVQDICADGGGGQSRQLRDLQRGCQYLLNSELQPLLPHWPEERQIPAGHQQNLTSLSSDLDAAEPQA